MKIFVSGPQSPNTHSPIDFTPSGIITDFKEEQNSVFPIVVTELGRTTKIDVPRAKNTLLLIEDTP